MDNFYKENAGLINKEQGVKKATAGIMAYLPSVFLMLLAIGLSALGSLMQFKFNLKEIVWNTFLISLGLRIVCIFLSKYVGSNIYYNKALYSDEMLDAKSKFIDLAEKVDQSELETYVGEFNLKSKIDAYKTKKKTKIATLTSKKNRLEYLNKNKYKKGREKAIKHLTQRIEELERVSTDEFIEENIKYIKVKYSKVKSVYFLSPTDEVDYKVKYSVNFSRQNSIEITKSLPLTILLAVFSATIGYGVAFGQANVVSILFDISTLLFNFIVGWFVVGRKIAANTLIAYINRTLFLHKYNDYKKNN